MTDTISETPITAQEPQPEAVAETSVEEREDAYLMQIDGDDPDDSPDPVEEVAQPEAPAEEAAPEQEPESSSDIDTDALEEAWSVLRRDGFSKDDLAALSDEAITRLAAHRKKVQSDVDRMLNESKQATTSEEAQQSPAEREEPTTAEAPERQPVPANLQQAAKQFADYVGSDEKGDDLLAQSYESLLAPMTQQIVALQNYVAGQQIESARARLADKYPQVADTSSEDYQRVVKRMNKLYGDESHKDIASLMEDAIAFEFRDQLKQEAESAKTQIRNLRNNGTPAKATGATPDAPALSGEEIEDQILAILESDAPDRVERARRLSGR